MEKIKELYLKYKEIVNYLIVGVLTTLVGLGVYYGLVFTILDPKNPIQLQVANIISWIAAVTFAYFTNRRFVFESKSENVLNEAARFYLARVGTLLMDMGIMFAGVTLMGLNDKYGKLPTIQGIEAPGDSYIFKDVYPHGAEFESELTAYRVYVDNRQNIDLYGKRKRQLELEKTHFYSVQEDLDAGYGNDVLWAGGSMGCGTLREFKDGGPVLIDDVKLRGQRVVAYGPLRAVVEMRDMGWNGNHVVTRYIMYAGHREVEVQVQADGALRHWQLCTGVQKVGADPVGWTRQNGLAASWGSDYPDYGKKELYKPEAVGLGVYVPEAFFAGTAEDSLQYMCKLRLNKQHFLKYYVTFCADMEEKGYHSADEWFTYLQAWREEMLTQPRIKYFIRLNNK